MSVVAGAPPASDPCLLWLLGLLPVGSLMLMSAVSVMDVPTDKRTIADG